MTEPTFTRLVDWVDGHVEDDEAAEIADTVADSPKLIETVEWIRQFRDAGLAMPLEQPPEELRNDVRGRLRAAFDHVTTGAPDRNSADVIALETHRLAPAAGMRAKGMLEAQRLSLDGDVGSLNVTVVPRDSRTVDVRGTAVLSSTEPLEVMLTGHEPTHRRIARVSRNGRFEFSEVSCVMRELWLFADGVRACGSLPLNEFA